MNTENIERGRHFILDGGEVRAVDLLTWAAWFESHTEDRVIALTVVQPEIKVSTVFLGLDHSFRMTGPPLIFETMVFGGFLDQEQVRYATIAEARAGHFAMVERVKRAEAGESI
ncbi:MAG: hypothetical protein ACRCZI_15630 [Cetobacterium sp.]